MPFTHVWGLTGVLPEALEQGDVIQRRRPARAGLLHWIGLFFASAAGRQWDRPADFRLPDLTTEKPREKRQDQQ
jgi:hypothetical protein